MQLTFREDRSLTSSVDWPLSSQDEIYGFFDEHSDQHFIEY